MKKSDSFANDICVPKSLIRLKFQNLQCIFKVSGGLKRTLYQNGKKAIVSALFRAYVYKILTEINSSFYI